MWFQGAAMIWCGLAMLGIMAIVLLTLAIIINHDVVIDVESHHLVLLFVYVIIAMIMISQGLSTFIQQSQWTPQASSWAKLQHMRQEKSRRNFMNFL